MATKPTKPVPAGPRKITGTASSKKVENKTLKPGSMVGSAKIVDAKPRPATPGKKPASPNGQPAGYRNEAYARAMGRGKMERNTTPRLKSKASLDEAAAAKRAGAAIAKRNTERSRQYSPTPMSAAAKEKMRRAAEKKSALMKMKKDPIVKGVKIALKAGANPTGAAAMLAGKAAGMYIKAGKAVVKTVKDKVSPPKRNVAPGGKAFTPAQRAALKKMLSQGGRLDK